MNKTPIEERIANLFRNISQPERIRILFAIGGGEACVCHLEASLGLRQAYISQHLMALREARILKSSREGRYVYYRLAHPELLDVIREAGRMIGVTEAQLERSAADNNGTACPCPKCNQKTMQADSCDCKTETMIRTSEVA